MSGASLRAAPLKIGWRGGFDLVTDFAVLSNAIRFSLNFCIKMRGDLNLSSVVNMKGEDKKAFLQRAGRELFAQNRSLAVLHTPQDSLTNEELQYLQRAMVLKMDDKIR